MERKDILSRLRTQVWETSYLTTLWCWPKYRWVVQLINSILYCNTWQKACKIEHLVSDTRDRCMSYIVDRCHSTVNRQASHLMSDTHICQVSQLPHTFILFNITLNILFCHSSSRFWVGCQGKNWQVREESGNFWCRNWCCCWYK